MKLSRWLKHLLLPDWWLRRVFSKADLAAIGEAIAVGEYLDAPVDQLHVDQDAGVFFGIPDAQPGKQLDRPLSWRGVAPQRRQRQRAFDDEAQFAAMRLFAGGNGRADGGEIVARKCTPDEPVRQQ